MRSAYKIASLAAFCLLAVSALATWFVNPGLTITDAGIDIKTSNQQYMNCFYRLSDGTPHATFGFYSDQTQVWDVNLSNSVSRVFTVGAGLPPHNPALTFNDILVITTSDPGHMTTYKPATGVTNYIKACSDRDYYSAVIGDDQHAYFGTYGPLGTAESYDPILETGKEWGQFDESLENGSVYIYSIGADSNYIYGAVRELTSAMNWYLGIIEKANTNKTLVWKGGACDFTEVYKGTNGFWYCQQNTNGGPVRHWLLTNSVPVLQAGVPGRISPWLIANVDSDMEFWNLNQGWDVSADFDVTSVSGSMPTATIGFKPTNEVDFVSVTETNGWLVVPTNIDILQKWTNGSFLWQVNGYGPTGTLVPGGLTAIIGPYKAASIYDVLQVSATEVYLSGYHRNSLRWDPTQPWTRVPLMPNYLLTNINPFTCVADWGKYHYYMARGNNGKIFIASHHERGSTGGELGWYEPSDNTHGGERTEFLDFDVRDLKSAEGGSKLVYVSSNTNIFVWDVATFTKLTNFTVFNGSTSLDKVVEYSPGKFFGVIGTMSVGFTTAGVQLFTNLLPGTAWGVLNSVRHRLTLGPDNYVWLCANGQLNRINPTNGSYVSVLTTTNGYNVVFDGTDVYMYGLKQVLKVANLLTNIPRIDMQAASFNVGTARAAQ